MKKNLITLAMIFSVVLNLGFIGIYCFQRADLYARKQGHASHKQFLYEELNLSPEQLEKFEPGRDSFHAYLNRQGKRIQARRLELIDLLAEDVPDRKAIEAKHKQIQLLQQQMQTRVIDHFINESSILTAEQRKKFFVLIKGRIGKNEGSCPGWMLRVRPESAPGESR